MFTKFDEIDLIDFFNAEPVMIGDPQAGIYMFVSENTPKQVLNLSLIVVIDVYDKHITISLSYNNDIIFDGRFENVSKIVKEEHEPVLYIYTQAYRIVLKRYNVYGVILEEL